MDAPIRLLTDEQRAQVEANTDFYLRGKREAQLSAKACVEAIFDEYLNIPLSPDAERAARQLKCKVEAFFRDLK